MDGIGLDNMLGAEQLEKMFGDSSASEETVEQNSGGETPESNENNETEETAEVDFSDLLGNQPESVGSEEHTEGNGETPESKNGPGTPQKNLFSSIAEAIRDEGVFPDLSDDELKDVKDAASLRKMFDSQITKMFDDRQKRLEQAMNGGATPDELKDYQNAMNVSQYLANKEVTDLLGKEGDEGDRLRKQLMYQDYINRGFKHERAVKLVEKSFDAGTDMEDAKEAYESCRQFYKEKVEDYQEEMAERQKMYETNQQRQYENLKKKILETESFYGGVKVDKNIRQKAYETLTKPVYRDEQGNYLTALQKYQRENPAEFMINMALMMELTDGFKSVDKLTKDKVKKDLKKGFAELESVLNSTARKGDGSLNLANTSPEFGEREKWQLAI